MRCKNCGSELRPENQFCPICGEPVKKKRNRLLIPTLCIAAASGFAAVLIFIALQGGRKPSSNHTETANGGYSSESTQPDAENAERSAGGIILETDESYLIAGEETAVLFTARTEETPAEMDLYNSEDEWIASFYDDGTGGDEAAGDGIYSCTVSLSGDAAGTESFYAKAEEAYSADAQIWYFEQPTQEEAEEAEQIYYDVVSGIDNAEHTYLDSEGYVPADQAENAAGDVYAYLSECLEDGTLVRVLKEGNSIYAKFASGISLVYEPGIKDVSSGGTEVELYACTYQPNTDLASDTVSEGVSEAVKEVSNCYFAADYRNGEVTLELIKTLPKDEVVFWNGHGGYGPSVHSFLCTGEAWDWNAWWFDWNYFTDSVSDRILLRGTEAQSDLACFTSKFVDKYCGDLSNSLFLLSSCHSGQDTTLANAFLNKGADAVLGFTETVYSGYCLSICYEIMVYMGQVDSETEDYYTLEAALALAIEDLGEDDLAWAASNLQGKIKSERAAPVIIGDGAYQLGVNEPPVVYASTIASYNGTTYWVKENSLSAPVSLQPLETLNIEPALYDYICYFAFYRDRVYYACKEGGTSGYSAAIFSCNPDGSDEKMLVNSVFNGTERELFYGAFYIMDGKLYYMEGQKYVDLETGETGSNPSQEVPEEEIFYTGGNGYFVMDNAIWKGTYDPTEGTYEASEQIFRCENNYLHLQAVLPNGLYYTTIKDSTGYLYFYDFEAGESIIVDTHPTAGGGDVYFNW